MIAITKNSREELRIAREDFRGHDVVNIRVWYYAGEEFRPSKKGFAIRSEQLPELIQALQVVSQEREAA